jgi:D-alanyl-D-alanine dipeptidase
MKKSTTGACIVAASLLTPALQAQAQTDDTAPIPVGFVHLTDIAQTAQLDIRYAGSNNFMGRPAVGYAAPTCILTAPAAARLQAVQHELKPLGLSIKVFDCYRPRSAVHDFVAWTRDPDDLKNQADYYPTVAKEDLLRQGYIAEPSAHSRGSTVDLTLVALDPASTATLPTQGPLLPNGEVDMGTPFDLFDIKSHTDNQGLPEHVRHNRRFLQALMARHGFLGLPEEWWHFTLKSEPYPSTYFNFPVR